MPIVVLVASCCLAVLSVFNILLGIKRLIYAYKAPTVGLWTLFTVAGMFNFASSTLNVINYIGVLKRWAVEDANLLLFAIASAFQIVAYIAGRYGLEAQEKKVMSQ